MERAFVNAGGMGRPKATGKNGHSKKPMKVTTAMKAMKATGKKGKGKKPFKVTTAMKVMKATCKKGKGKKLCKVTTAMKAMKATTVVNMDDVWEKLRAQWKAMTFGAFTSRAYDNGVRRARAAGRTNEAAGEFGRKMYAKASSLWTKLGGK